MDLMEMVNVNFVIYSCFFGVVGCFGMLEKIVILFLSYVMVVFI